LDLRGGLNFALLLNGGTAEIRLGFWSNEPDRWPAAESSKMADNQRAEKRRIGAMDFEGRPWRTGDALEFEPFLAGGSPASFA
jgi:hypothetical protein